MRLLYSFGFAICISVGIFFGMQQMIAADNTVLEKKEKPIVLNYLREQKDIKVQKEKRIKPKEPVKKIEPKRLDIVKTKMTKINKNIKIKPLSVAKNIDISAISSLNGAQISVDSGLFDANNLQTITRVNPLYPRRAKVRSKEGYVQLQFHISKNGNVSDVKILDSNPQGFFEDSAITAIKKWRFKPSKDEKDASIKFNFRLAK
ncbi:TonB family protein [Halarcobacter sp.]|uniref:energy transducer TonB n=1 Tax=Halarcobacter sp. TaxID=2321133 RepID=UPI0029F5194B|nr:TonB family protein [Halarcobacter sp.]